MDAIKLLENETIKKIDYNESQKETYILIETESGDTYKINCKRDNYTDTIYFELILK
jgi:hypothetical protein